MIAALIGLPRWAQALGGAVLLIGAFLLWDWLDDRAAVTAHEGRIAGEVARQTSAAATSAAAAVHQTQTEVDQTNDEARRAAAGSDDPLRSGLDRLRADQRPRGAAAP